METFSKREYEALVGKNADDYLPRFAKFESQGGQFSPTWHWPAFLVGFWWFLYRKLYLWALIAAVLWFVPGGFLLARIVYGLTGHFIYYKDARRKILSLKSTYPEEDIAPLAAGMGGVHKWVPVLAVILVLLSIIGWIAAAMLGLMAMTLSP